MSVILYFKHIKVKEKCLFLSESIFTLITKQTSLKLLIKGMLKSN